MKIERREHYSTYDGGHVVRFHVVDAEGRCIPEVCTGSRTLCGYLRRYQARDALVRYRRDLAAIEAAGSRW